jgi:hypothetical protein
LVKLLVVAPLIPFLRQPMAMPRLLRLVSRAGKGPKRREALRAVWVAMRRSEMTATSPAEQDLRIVYWDR